VSTSPPGSPTSAVLNPRGRAVVAAGVALLFIAATAGAPWVAAAGAALIALVTMALGWGREAAARLDALALTWTSDAVPMKPCGQPTTLGLRVQALAVGDARGLRVEPLVSGPCPVAVAPLTIDAPGQAQGEFAVTFTLPRAGLWRVWGCRLTLGDALGLTTQTRWHALPLLVHAGPRPVAPSTATALLNRIGAVRDREGRHLDRQSGSGLELRELREYVPGDPLKAIAWKASARRQRWLVRAYEDESMRRFQVVLAIGRTMRDGEPGHTALDAGIDLAASLLQLASGERVGLTTYDHRVVAHIRPDTGRPHAQRLLQQLLDVTRVVDADLTEISDAELFARVGELLEGQEGLSLRRLPYDLSRLSQPDVLVDPVRELYDESAIFTHVSQVVARERDRGHAALFGKSRPAADLASARLRLYCALHAIPLPYRRAPAPDAAETGLSQALSRSLVAGAAETLVLLTDFRGLRPDGPAVRTLALCRAHKRRVVAVSLGASPEPELRRALLAAGVRWVETARPEKRSATAA
jgi:uncharacterized protein (DUF58 family)